MKGEYALIHRPVYLFLKHCKHTFENLDPPQKKIHFDLNYKMI